MLTFDFWRQYFKKKKIKRKRNDKTSGNLNRETIINLVPSHMERSCFYTKYDLP